MRNTVILLAALGLSACGIGDRLGLNRVTSDRAQPYRAVLKKAEDPRLFTVAVEAPGATVDAVRESVRYPATRYCIESFGSSDIAWTIDPATGDWQRLIDGATQVFSGSCSAR